MKFDFNRFLSVVITKSELSLVVDGLWIARSAINATLNNKVIPLFGFGASYDKKFAECKSKYELLEHLIFMPYFHTQNSLNSLPIIHLNQVNAKPILFCDLMIGAPSYNGMFTANGCAISNNIDDAISHSRAELLERHLCCVIWYHKMPVFQQNNFASNIIDSSVAINAYTTSALESEKFIMVSMECSKSGFFAIGAAIKSKSLDAYQHATSEAAMLFDDFKRNRTSKSSTKESQNRILSLRQKDISTRRKNYFNALVNAKINLSTCALPTIQTVVFEVLPGFYAARSFASDVLEPHHFEATPDIPNLPLF